MTTDHRSDPRRPLAAVVVDDELTWIVQMPTMAMATALAASPEALAQLAADLDRERAATLGAGLEAAWVEAGLVDAAARMVSAYLEDLPDLPLIGEPFGGEEGSD